MHFPLVLWFKWDATWQVNGVVGRHMRVNMAGRPKALKASSEQLPCNLKIAVTT